MFECSGVKVRLWCGTGCDGAENLRFFIPFGRSFFFLYHSSSLGCMLSCFSCVQLFATPQTVAHQAPLSMGFSKKEYWNGLPFLLLGCLPNPGIKPVPNSLLNGPKPTIRAGVSFFPWPSLWSRPHSGNTSLNHWFMFARCLDRTGSPHR